MLAVEKWKWKNSILIILISPQVRASGCSSRVLCNFVTVFRLGCLSLRTRLCKKYTHLSKKHYKNKLQVLLLFTFTSLTAVTSLTVEGHPLLSLGSIYRLFHFEEFLSVFRIFTINFVDCSYKVIIDSWHCLCQQ